MSWVDFARSFQFQPFSLFGLPVVCFVMQIFSLSSVSLFIIVNLSATFGAAVDADVGMFGCWVAGMWMLGWELNAGTGNW